MGEEKRSRWQKLPKLKLILLLIIIGILVWAAVPHIQEFFKYEELVLYSYRWTVNSEGNITQVTLHLRNNGTKKLTISDVFVNETLINSTEWGSRLGKTFSPRNWCWMYIAPESMVFKEDSTYNLTIGTEAGGFFSYLIKVEDGDHIGPEECNTAGGLFLDLTIFDGGVYAAVFFENHGKFPVVVVEGQVNGTSFDIGRVWVTYKNVGPEARSIHFYFRWAHGTTYNFTLITAAGNTYTHIMAAERLDLVSYRWTVNSEGNITQVTLHLRNNGTKWLEINRVFVNETLINSNEWGCDCDNNLLEPKRWMWMYIAPESMIFKEGFTYKFTITTARGSSFSYLFKVEDGDFIETEKFKIVGGRWSYVAAILDVETYGTIPVTVVEGRVNDRLCDIGEVWVFPGETRVHFYFQWILGVTYNFTLKTACGNTYAYTMTVD